VATAHGDSFEQAVARGGDALKQGKIDEAVAALKGALAITPDSTRVLALLGLAYFRGAHLDQARPIYEDLVERMPTDASHRLNLGLVYLKLGNSEQAIRSLEASRALDPGQGRAVSYLGLAYARAGRYAEAYRSFLLANQNDLASEIQDNLTGAERDGIHSQLGRTPAGPLAGAAAPALPRTTTNDAPAIPRTATSEARTKPPNPPPGAPPLSRAPEPPLGIGDRSTIGIGIQSMAAILIDKPPVDDARSAPPPRAAAAAAAPQQPARMTESMQFVIGRGEVTPIDGNRDVSQAVAAATPVSAPATAAVRPTSTIPLSQLAITELVRPEDGEGAFELAPGGQLIIRVAERVMTRLDGVHVTAGELAYEPAMRRSRGHNTDEAFDFGGAPLYAATGHGYLIALSGDRTFTAVTLDDDIFYVREDLVFAFEATLRWESGNVPGLRGQLPVVQFRGDGAVALRLPKPLVRVKLAPAGVVFVDASRLGGWIGRVIPRAVVPPPGSPLGEVCVECSGEGIVLVDPSGAPRARPPEVATAPSTSTGATPPPPPQPQAGDAAPSADPDSPDNKTVAELLGDLGADDDDETDPHRDEI
jgi:uncharacterized protein (AIM24 family)